MHMLLVHRKCKEKIMFWPLCFELNYVTLPHISHELLAGTQTATMAQQTSEDLSSDLTLHQDIEHTALFTEGLRTIWTLGKIWAKFCKCSPLSFSFSGCFGVCMQLHSGLGCSQRNAATSWWDGDVGLVLGKEGRVCHLPPAPPPISLAIRTGLICLTVMPTQSCSCGSANLNVSCLVLVYYQRGIHHHSCQVSSRSFLRQTPVSPQLSGLLLYCDFLFTQHMFPNSFKRQLSFMKVFFFFFLFINLSLDRCLTVIRHKPTSPCKVLFSPKGLTCRYTTSKFEHKAIALRNNFPKIPYFWAGPKFPLYLPAKSALFLGLFKLYCLSTHQL